MKKIIEKGFEINEAYDVNTAVSHTYFLTVKEWVNNQNKSIGELDAAAKEFGNQALAFRIMLKFIESEKVITNLSEKLTITLINPVYKETGRMQKREEHPHGENSIRNKIGTINYFESLNPNFSGRLFVVDDGCPDGSGKMAEEILNSYPNSPHKAFFLGEAIDSNDADLPSGLTHKNGSNRSVKGGATLYGMKKALNDEVEGRHIIIDNDADLSVHPMQLGLLIKDIIAGKAKAIAGSRRENDSVSLIGGERNKRGNLFIKLWQHFLPDLASNITDTNRAFKAFDSEALRKILPHIKIYTFPYQIELLQACISLELPLLKKGIGYIDSEAASTQSGDNITETYLNQVNQIIDIAMRYKTISESDALVNYFKSISEDDWRKIEANPPEDIMDLVK